MKIWKISIQEHGDTSVFIGKIYYIKADTLTDALMKVPKGVPCRGELWIEGEIIGLEN